eukprot:2892660-Prymnesium_polylepis.1
MERTGYDSCGMESPPGYRCTTAHWRNGALAEGGSVSVCVCYGPTGRGTRTGHACVTLYGSTCFVCVNGLRGRGMCVTGRRSCVCYGPTGRGTRTGHASGSRNRHGGATRDA